MKKTILVTVIVTLTLLSGCVAERKPLPLEAKKIKKIISDTNCEMIATKQTIGYIIDSVDNIKRKTYENGGNAYNIVSQIPYDGYMVYTIDIYKCK